MKEIISSLRALQEIDNEILRVKKEKINLSEKINALKEILVNNEKEIQEKKEKLQEAERWYHEKDKEFKEEMERIRKMQARLNALSKTKEYTAAQREIEIMKKATSQKEDEILKLLSAIDDYKNSISNDEKKIAEMKSEIEQEDTSTSEIIKVLNERLDEIKEKREGYEGKIPEDTKQRYLKIQEAMGGVAVVEVKNGCCFGCHRQIPPQLFNILLMHISLENCPFCKRFIYVDTEPRDPDDD